MNTVTKGKQDRSAREQALVEAATAVFAEHGYAHATTREVAERAGCSEGLIHRYFGGKRGLLMAALEQKADRMQDLVREGVPDQDSLHDEVSELMTWSLDFAWEHRDFMRVSSAQGIIDPGVGKVIGDRLNAARVAVIEEKLRRHRDVGRVRADVDLYVAAQMIAGLTYQSGFFLQVVFSMPREEVHSIVREVAHIVIRGIEADPATTAAAGVRRRA